MAPRLSHIDATGRARMVDVGDKPETSRVAIASAAVRMSRATLALVMASGGAGRAARGDQARPRAGGGVGQPPRARSVGARRAPVLAKGDVLATARIAAISALKRTSDLIPLCHPVRLVDSAVDLDPDPRLPGIRVRVTARAVDRTGVEMEAMVGATVAVLTVYDMVKGVERGVEILHVRLEHKSGGRSGEWNREPTPRRGIKRTPGSLRQEHGRGHAP